MLLFAAGRWMRFAVSLRARARPYLPARVLALYRHCRARLQQRRNARLSARQVFTLIYERNQWGGAAGDFCSGGGSTAAQARAYSEVVKRFIEQHGIRDVVDLGCGDFVVGKQVASTGVAYTGVDIVPELVARNQSVFGSESVRFSCLDISCDALPDGDLCLLRQVLQHLSNAEIAAVLRNVRKYRYVIISEHYPAPSVYAVPNLDKPHGPDIRVAYGSAVHIDKAPFDTKVSDVLLEVPATPCLASGGEVIRTFLVEHDVGS